MSLPDDFLAAVPETIAAAFHARLPGLRSCEVIEGALDGPELKRRSTNAPAVFVTVLDAEEATGSIRQQRIFDLGMAAYVVTKNSADLTARAASWAITQALLPMIPDTRWDLECCGPAEQVRQRTTITPAIRAMQLHLSVIAWKQPVTLQPAEQTEPVPLELYVGQAPEIGPDHVNAYRRIEGDDV